MGRKAVGAEKTRLAVCVSGFESDLAVFAPTNLGSLDLNFLALWLVCVLLVSFE